MNTTKTVDPVTVEVIRSYYRSTANQMSTALMRASFSPIIYEVRDFSLGVYNERAELIAEGKGLPVFMGTLTYTIRTVMDYVGKENVQEGDMLLCTYPYWTGAHSQDAVTILPIFENGEIIAYSAAKAHWMDLGAKDIYGTDTTDIFQEGLQLKAVKIMKAGKLDEELMDILRANTRLPDVLTGDLTAQISACELGARRLRDLSAKYGVEVVRAATNRILDHGEEIARKAITAMPDGEWTSEVAIDNDGIVDEPVVIRLKVTISGDQMHVDLTGTASQTKGPINCPFVSTMSSLRLAMKMMVAPHYDANEGFFRPLSVFAPEGTLLNPTKPAPVFIYGWSVMAVGEAMFAAMAKGAPNLSISRTGGDIGAVLWSGTDPATGEFFAGGGDEAVGNGASCDADGENALIHFTLGECRNIPVEILEERYPILTVAYGLRHDSAGAGRFRGGLGVTREWRILGDLSIISVVDQTRGGVEGVEGGLAAKPNRILIYPDSPEQRIEGKLTGFQLKAGEHIRVETAGGAGWGDPRQRDAAEVLADVRGGYVSRESAEADYKVVLTGDGAGLSVDQDATANLRKVAA
ncbi:hydantoinase B/oxoprolinase family protein [Novosphingobium sp. AP12]|uniref:hydantoinase B/oxoprolinase family protein n=1 Tax=Novosphingobium sp. AP12 TaxID=1144305 RepID=UPI0002720008|nr:hydantoinase B/oxoprolinase family protein [Novosphingobium sp. AP12]EJL30840.1 N-methylhydantoinase B/acetone carboxylase, alpha subunit [Novosphingobium sp. AP12]